MLSQALRRPSLAFQILELLGAFSGMFYAPRGWQPANLNQLPRPTAPERLEGESFEAYRARRTDAQDRGKKHLQPIGHVPSGSTVKRRHLVREIGARQFKRMHRQSRMQL